MTGLSRRVVLTGAVATLAQPAPAFAETPEARLYRRAIVIDAQCSPGGSDPNAAPDAPLNAQDLSDVRVSGLTALSVTVGSVGNSTTSFEETVNDIGLMDREISAHSDLMMRILTANDLATAKHTGRMGVIYNFQDTAMLGSGVERIALFHNLGVRIIQLTYNRRNLVGEGCLEPSNAGLSTFGHTVVEELNARRILVDLSHASQRTIADGIGASSAPVTISHTGCRALVDFPRNTGDAELRALAQKGGVAGLYFMPFLRSSGQPHSDDLLAHIDHAVNVCGEDHVGIGTDGGTSGTVINDAARAAQRAFVADRRRLGIAAPGEDENVFNLLPEYNEPRRFEHLAGDLLRRGYSEARVEKILGGNFARLFREIWA